MKLIVASKKSNQIFVGIHQKIYQIKLQGSSDGEECVLKAFELPGMVNLDYGVVSIELDAAEEHLYAIFSNKYLCSWNIVTGDLIGKRILKKKATALVLPQWKSDTAALISDKAGDVWGYNGPAFTKEELLAGHTASVITDMCYIKESSLIATADRDEKIRISSFPDLETIQGYLLGHASVISSIAQLTTSNNRSVLVSTGWDHKIVVWDLETFEVKQELVLGSAASLPMSTKSEEQESKVETNHTDEDHEQEEEKAEDNEGEDEDNRKYEEAEFGHYPFKITRFQSLLAVIYKDEAKVDLFRLGDQSELLVFDKTIQLPAIAIDIAFLSASHLATILPQPHYIQICSIDSDDLTLSQFFIKLDQSIDQSYYISLMGYDGDSGMRNTL